MSKPITHPVSYWAHFRYWIINAFDGKTWKGFSERPFIRDLFCCPAGVMMNVPFSRPGTQSHTLPLNHFENTMDNFATHSSSIDLSMCFPSNQVLPTILYHSLDIKLLSLIIALAIVHREKPVRASEGWTGIIHRVGNTLFWPLEGSQFVHELCRGTGRMRRKSEWSAQLQGPVTSVHGWQNLSENILQTQALLLVLYSCIHYTRTGGRQGSSWGNVQF